MNLNTHTFLLFPSGVVYFPGLFAGYDRTCGSGRVGMSLKSHGLGLVRSGRVRIYFKLSRAGSGLSYPTQPVNGLPVDAHRIDRSSTDSSSTDIPSTDRSSRSYAAVMVFCVESEETAVQIRPRKLVLKILHIVRGCLPPTCELDHADREPTCPDLS